jgi:hypothetical protein
VKYQLTNISMINNSISRPRGGGIGRRQVLRKWFWGTVEVRLRYRWVSDIRLSISWASAEHQLSLSWGSNEVRFFLGTVEVFLSLSSGWGKGSYSKSPQSIVFMVWVWFEYDLSRFWDYFLKPQIFLNFTQRNLKFTQIQPNHFREKTYIYSKSTQSFGETLLKWLLKKTNSIIYLDSTPIQPRCQLDNCKTNHVSLAIDIAESELFFFSVIVWRVTEQV